MSREGHFHAIRHVSLDSNQPVDIIRANCFLTAAFCAGRIEYAAHPPELAHNLASLLGQHHSSYTNVVTLGIRPYVDVDEPITGSVSICSPAKYGGGA